MTALHRKFLMRRGASESLQFNSHRRDDDSGGGGFEAGRNKFASWSLSWLLYVVIAVTTALTTPVSAGYACLSNPCVFGVCIDDLNRWVTVEQRYLVSDLVCLQFGKVSFCANIRALQKCFKYGFSHLWGEFGSGLSWLITVLFRSFSTIPLRDL